MKKKSAFSILFTFFAFFAFSQDDVFAVTLNSIVLKESRKIMVYVPKQSNVKKQSYPVIYVFDGESLFPCTVGAIKFMNYSSSMPQMPEAIVVGIINTHRDRDMPVPQEMAATSGAKNFLEFVSKELIPYVNKQYPVNGLNVLIGHSQGGLFVTYAGFELPQLFPCILSLDAPMTVNPSLLKLYQQKIASSCTLNYFSGETKFGWGKNFSPPYCNGFMQKQIEDETHETMPYKGIYDGLKFLFREFIPPQNDVPLSVLQEYYDRLSKKYNCRFGIPSAVLLAAATQTINQFKKEIALAIIGQYEKTYGEDKQSADLVKKANSIVKGPDERVDFYLNHPSPSTEELKPFMGKWKGVLHVPGGEDMSMVCEIKKVNDKYVWFARVMDEFDDISAFLAVMDKHELAWGRKHGAGGIYLSVGKLSDDGQRLTGTEEMVGINIPDGMTPPKPNTFEFKKIKE